MPGECLSCHYLLGAQNTTADWLSRHQELVDPDNYRLAQKWFRKVCHHFHFQPSVDLFANQLNNQSERYCAWGRDHRALGTAYALDWSRELALANPPLLPSGSDVGQDCPAPSNSACVSSDVDESTMVGKLQSMRLGPPSLSEGWGFFEILKDILYPHRLGQPFSWLSDVDWC